MSPNFTTIYLASDHAGFEYKEIVKTHLEETGYTIIDCGAEELVPDDDYPDYMTKAALEVSRNPDSGAIIFGGSGQGEAIVANRFPRVRAAVCYGGEKALEIAKVSRQHNDANILSIGARFVRADELLEIVDMWLNTSFSNDERHARRLEKIKNIHM
jgi:ribose 5-phosphate isomerase B